MRALVAAELIGPDGLELQEREDLEPGRGEVVVGIEAAALNRRDLATTSGRFPGVSAGFVPGSDLVGRVRALGEGVDGFAVGDQVIGYPSLDWGTHPLAPGPEFTVLGGPSDGAFAEQIVLPSQNVAPKPARLSRDEAAALPLVGITIWRALHTRAQLQRGEALLVLGAGAGTSTMAVQMAAAAGARVFVTSSSQEKIDHAVALGAAGGVLYTDEGWVERARELAGGAFDVVLDSVGSTWEDSVSAVKVGGRVVVFGATGAPSGRTELNLGGLYRSQISLLGTMMGSPADFAGLLADVERASWRPVVDSTWPLEDAAEALRYLAGAGHFGKVVLEVA